MRFKKLPLFILVLFLFAYPAFAWQITPYEEEKALSVGQESQVILNLVFASLNYEEKDEFERDVSAIINRVRRTSPFDEFKGLRVYLLKVKPEEEAVLFKEGEKSPFLKISKDLMKQLKGQLPAGYKLVVLNKKGSVSAAELSNINKVSIVVLGKNKYYDSNNLAVVFLHELGHSLGLREENPYSSHTIIPGPPNCAPDKESAVRWWADMAGQVKGVTYVGLRSGKNKFIKPTFGSIMNDPFKSETYGPVNERYLRRELQ